VARGDAARAVHPLPWIAVLIANDRLPIKAEAVNRYEAERRQIEAREHPVIEG